MLSELINLLYDEIEDCKLNTPSFSMYRMMAILWRRIVLKPLSSKIHDIILNLFQIQRKRIGGSLIVSDTDIITNDNETEYLLIK